MLIIFFSWNKSSMFNYLYIVHFNILNVGTRAKDYMEPKPGAMLHDEPKST
jgi:hypothetical protein